MLRRDAHSRMDMIATAFNNMVDLHNDVTAELLSVKEELDSLRAETGKTNGAAPRKRGRPPKAKEE